MCTRAAHCLTASNAIEYGMRLGDYTTSAGTLLFNPSLCPVQDGCQITMVHPTGVCVASGISIPDGSACIPAGATDGAGSCESGICVSVAQCGDNVVGIGEECDADRKLHHLPSPNPRSPIVVRTRRLTPVPFSLGIALHTFATAYRAGYRAYHYSAYHATAAHAFPFPTHPPTPPRGHTAN